MRYEPKHISIEAVFLDTWVTAYKFLKSGEFSVIKHDGLYIVIPGGTIFAPIGECYLVRWPIGIEVMDKSEFETMYQEAK